MTELLKKSIVRIKRKDGSIVGVGFLVGDYQILTCAHVIKNALGIKTVQPGKPENDIHLDFAFIPERKTLTAQVIYWSPALKDGGSDIAGLELTGYPPPSARPAPIDLETVSFQQLRNIKYKAFGLPENLDEGVWSEGKVVEERADGLVQLENEKFAGEPIEPGFSGSAVWNENSSHVIGIISTAYKPDTKKIAFMIPIYKILDLWADLKNKPFQKKYVDIPVVVLAMEKDEAINLFDSNDKCFNEIKETFSKNGIKALLSQYAEKRDDWKPVNFEGKTIKEIIGNLIEDINSHRMKNQSTEYFRPRFVSDQFFNEDIDIRDTTRDELVDLKGIVVVDCISLFHADIREIFFYYEIGSEANVAILGIKPLNTRILQAHKAMEKKVMLFMPQPFNRFSKKFDETCEFGAYSLMSLERWLFKILHRTQIPGESKANPEKSRKFRRKTNKTPRGYQPVVWRDL